MSDDEINYEVIISGQVSCKRSEKEKTREQIEAAIDPLVENYEVLLDPMGDDIGKDVAEG